MYESLTTGLTTSSSGTAGAVPASVSLSTSTQEADALFKRLDLELAENIDAQYFSEPREFRYVGHSI